VLGGSLQRAELAAETGITVSVAENPLLAVAYGTGKILGDERLLTRLT
jgi:actin-like ATPase involved in cell morphogenesis